jgi:microsomal dipeptidase-like Zn-dependent dipeptidase
VDVPRLVEGGAALQAFTIVTKTPRGMNIERNTASTDNITLLAVAQLWPVRRAKKMVIDLAHASAATIDDVLRMATRPVVVSHTGVRGTCANQRNLDDAQLAAISANGGLIGIGFWETAVCGGDARAIARAVAHAKNVAGFEHVALGSDFDGAVTTPFDVTGLPQITQALLDAGLDQTAIEAVMGGNARRLLKKLLP